LAGRGRRGGARERGGGTDSGTNKEKPPVIELEGEIIEILPNTMFLVRPLGPDGKPLRIATGRSGQAPEGILAHLSGRMRMRFIRCGVGDRVKLELSPYDLTRGRITWRLRAERTETV
jgi:translation initiation factor IF-1